VAAEVAGVEGGGVAQVDDLLGTWKPESMAVPDSEVYDLLTFHKDGTGFLDFSSPETGYFCEHFRWSLNSTGELQLRGARVQRYKPNGSNLADSPSTVRADVAFSVRTEQTGFGRHTQVLRTGPCPWSALADPASVATQRYLVHEMTYATFHAPCFALAEEANDCTFRGKALSAYLAKRLRARRISVGKMQRVFMGACYFRKVEVSGQPLGLSVNWDWDLQKWWLRVSPPTIGGKAEVEELCDILREILQSVDGIHDLDWQIGERDQNELYSVTFTNMTDPSAEPAAGEYHLRANWVAGSEAEALDQALPWAVGFNNRGALPPHGVRVSAESLRDQATVVLHKEIDLEGYVAAFNRHRSRRPE
jgi:hypothetical protein